MKARHGCDFPQRIQQCTYLYSTINTTTQLLHFAGGDVLNLLLGSQSSQSIKCVCLLIVLVVGGGQSLLSKQMTDYI